MPGRRGDTEQLKALYGELVADHAPEIWRFAYRLSGQRSDADDLAQETYLEAWRSLPSLASPAAGRSWLLRILTRRASRLWTRRKRQPQQLRESDRAPKDGDALEHNPDCDRYRATAMHGATALTSSRLEMLGEERTLRQALDALSPDRRIAFLLVFQHGLTSQEAADVLDIPRRTVLSRVHRARQDLRVGLRRQVPSRIGEGGR